MASPIPEKFIVEDSLEFLEIFSEKLGKIKGFHTTVGFINDNQMLKRRGEPHEFAIEE